MPHSMSDIARSLAELERNPPRVPEGTVSAVPADLLCLGKYDAVYSNLDHAVEAAILAKVEAGTHWAVHAAWDHWGKVWFAPSDGKWFEEVWVDKAPIEVMVDDSLEALMRAVNEKYGDG